MKLFIFLLVCLTYSLVYTQEIPKKERKRRIQFEQVIQKDSLTPIESDQSVQEAMEKLETNTRNLFIYQDVVPTIIPIEGHTFKGVSVYLDGKVKTVEKAWRSYVKSSNKVKLHSRKGKSLISKKKVPYWKAKEIQLTDITERYGDLLTVFQIEKGRIKMSVIFKLGYNTAINKENFPNEYTRLAAYVDQFAKANFREYYEDHIKSLENSIDNTEKEIKKEEKFLTKRARLYKRKFLKKDLIDENEELTIALQEKLIKTLKDETNHYQYLIIEYKNRNSQIRKDLIYKD